MENQWTALFVCTCNSFLELIEELVAKGANVNFARPDKRCALTFATELGLVECTKVLIRLGASNLGRGLHWAIRAGQHEIMELLLGSDYAVDINWQDEKGMSFLMTALESKQLPCAFSLLDKKIDVNLQDKKGRTALMRAIELGADAEAIKRLLKARATLDIKSKDGRTALGFAAAAGHEDALSLLAAQGADLNARDSIGRTILMLSAVGGNVASVQMLLNRGGDVGLTDEQGESAIVHAARGGKMEVLELLLAFKNEPYQIRLACIAAAEAGSQKTLDRLLQAKTSDLERPVRLALCLIGACKFGRLGVVKSLLALDADPNSVHPEQGGALFDACANGHAKVVDVLIQAGANTNLQDALGRTPMNAVAEAGNPAVMKMLLDHDADPDHPGQRNRTPLIASCAFGSLESVELLLPVVEDFDCVDEDNNCALMHAVLGQHTDLVQLLLKAGADTEVFNSQGLSPLMAACLSGRVHIVWALIVRRANRRVYDRRDRSLLEMCEQEGQHASAQALREADDLDEQRRLLEIKRIQEIKDAEEAARLLYLQRVDQVKADSQAAIVLEAEHRALCLAKHKFPARPGSAPAVMNAEFVAHWLRTRDRRAAQVAAGEDPTMSPMASEVGWRFALDFKERREEPRQAPVLTQLRGVHAGGVADAAGGHFGHVRDDSFLFMSSREEEIVTDGRPKSAMLSLDIPGPEEIAELAQSPDTASPLPLTERTYPPSTATSPSGVPTLTPKSTRPRRPKYRQLLSPDSAEAQDWPSPVPARGSPKHGHRSPKASGSPRVASPRARALAAKLAQGALEPLPGGSQGDQSARDSDGENKDPFAAADAKGSKLRSSTSPGTMHKKNKKTRKLAKTMPAAGTLELARDPDAEYADELLRIYTSMRTHRPRETAALPSVAPPPAEDGPLEMSGVHPPCNRPAESSPTRMGLGTLAKAQAIERANSPPRRRSPPPKPQENHLGAPDQKVVNALRSSLGVASEWWQRRSGALTAQPQARRQLKTARNCKTAASKTKKQWSGTAAGAGPPPSAPTAWQDTPKTPTATHSPGQAVSSPVVDSPGAAPAPLTAGAVAAGRGPAGPQEHKAAAGKSKGRRRQPSKEDSGDEGSRVNLSPYLGHVTTVTKTQKEIRRAKTRAVAHVSFPQRNDLYRKLAQPLAAQDARPRRHPRLVYGCSIGHAGPTSFADSFAHSQVLSPGPQMSPLSPFPGSIPLSSSMYNAFSPPSSSYLQSPSSHRPGHVFSPHSPLPPTAPARPGSSVNFAANSTQIPNRPLGEHNSHNDTDKDRDRDRDKAAAAVGGTRPTVPQRGAPDSLPDSGRGPDPLPDSRGRRTPAGDIGSAPGTAGRVSVGGSDLGARGTTAGSEVTSLTSVGSPPETAGGGRRDRTAKPPTSAEVLAEAASVVDGHGPPPGHQPADGESRKDWHVYRRLSALLDQPSPLDLVHAEIAHRPTLDELEPRRLGRTISFQLPKKSKGWKVLRGQSCAQLVAKARGSPLSGSVSDSGSGLDPGRIPAPLLARVGSKLGGSMVNLASPKPLDNGALSATEKLLLNDERLSEWTTQEF